MAQHRKPEDNIIIDLGEFKPEDDLGSEQRDVLHDLTSELTDKVSGDDSNFLTVLGQGSFGKVSLVEKKTGADKGTHYAMKVLKKAALKVSDRERTKKERSILIQIDHPFIVKVHYAFQTEGKVYMCLDFVNGGDLFSRLSKEFRFAEKDVRFYLAELALALGHIHGLGIIHRDLKPDNVLLDSQGHIKLVDFGLCKENHDLEDGKTFSFCGTVEYMAPEVVSRRGHTQSCDWWSFAVLMYEMLIGDLPFQGASRNETIKKILGAKLAMPSFIQKTTQDLMRVLFKRSPNTRLGSGPEGVEEIKRHEYFKTIDWNKLFGKQINPPFVPKTSSKKDALTAAFDDEFKVLSALDTPGVPASVGAQETFRGFSYRDPKTKNVSNIPKKGKSTLMAPNPDNPVVRRIQMIGGLTTNHKDAKKPTFESEYLKKEEIGRGGYAECYHCTHISTNKDYAVKIIAKSGDQHVYDEVDIMSKTSQHPNIVTMLDLFEDQSNVYIVMEYLEGGELYDEIEKQKVFTEKEASPVICQIAMVIKYLHANDIVHRDLKPSNIMYLNDLKSANSLRICDFGFAKLLRNNNALMTPCFTANYAAPEVLQSQNSSQGYDKSCDIWSLGVILYVLLSGKFPFSAEKESDQLLESKVSQDSLKLEAHSSATSASSDILKKIQDLDINAVTSESTWSHISETGKDLVRKMMCKDAKNRITAEEILSHPWISDIHQLPESPLPVGGIQKQSIKFMNKMNEANRPKDKKKKTKLGFKISLDGLKEGLLKKRHSKNMNNSK